MYFEGDYEEYRKTIYLSNDKEERKTELENMFKEINNRVYNRYNQKEYLVEIIKNLNMQYSFYDDKKKDKYKPENIKIGNNKLFSYMSGNQEIDLFISTEITYTLENDEEKEEYKLFKNLNEKYGNIKILI
jgi:hypothetical protein